MSRNAAELMGRGHQNSGGGAPPNQVNRFAFAPAVRATKKLRAALIGPAGSGKTLTALNVTRGLVGQGGRIAVIDTERGSASLYAGIHSFDVLNLEPPFALNVFIEAIMAAEHSGYDAVVIDSLSHAWEGSGGALEMVDEASRRTRGNSFAAWKDVTPWQRKLVDTILGLGCHVITTMRTKTEYVQEQQERNGRTITVPKKVGLAPIQRQGMDYEFDLVGEIDTDHFMHISKSRFSEIDSAVIEKPSAELGAQIAQILTGVTPAPTEPDVAEAGIDAENFWIEMAAAVPKATPEDVDKWCTDHGRPLPDEMSDGHRMKCLKYFQSPPGQEALADWMGKSPVDNAIRTQIDALSIEQCKLVASALLSSDTIDVSDADLRTVMVDKLSQRGVSVDDITAVLVGG